MLFLDPNDQEWPDGVPAEKDCKKCVNVHSVLKRLLNVVPM